MQKSLKSALKDLYFSKNGSKIGPDFRFGNEFEFPIVSLDGSPPNELFLKTIITSLARIYHYEPTLLDKEGNYIKAVDINGAIISFEACYGILELSMPPQKTIHEMSKSFTLLFKNIESYLHQNGLKLIGAGLHPYAWAKTISPLATPYIAMIYTMSKMFAPPSSKKITYFHSITCANQIHLDVHEENAVDIVNIFNALSWAKALLFSNSPNAHENLSHQCLSMRDLYYKDNSLGYNPHNVGPDKHLFISLEELLSHQLQKSIFYVIRDMKYIFFEPTPLIQFFSLPQVNGYTVDENGSLHKQVFTPEPGDLTFFRSYNHASLTKKGTIEIRSECQQPFSDILTTTAFHLGILFNIQKVKAYVFQHIDHKTDLNQLRYDAVCKGYTIQNQLPFDVISFIQTILNLAKEGLCDRGFSEESYLDPLFDRLKRRSNPALDLMNERKTNSNYTSCFAMHNIRTPL